MAHRAGLQVAGAATRPPLARAAVALTDTAEGARGRSDVRQELQVVAHQTGDQVIPRDLFLAAPPHRRRQPRLVQQAHKLLGREGRAVDDDARRATAHLLGKLTNRPTTAGFPSHWHSATPQPKPRGTASWIVTATARSSAFVFGRAEIGVLGEHVNVGVASGGRHHLAQITLRPRRRQ